MIDFKPLILSESNISLLYSWLNKPHVREHWHEESITLNQIREKYEKRIESKSDFPYIIEVDGRPIGYIQSYYAPEVGEGWWENEPKGTWGLDMYIGEEDALGKGLGSEIAVQFAEKLFKEENAKCVIVDPTPDNKRAIQTYENAGFSRVKEIITPDGKALLMKKNK